jgi:glutamine cyclotransferase
MKLPITVLMMAGLMLLACATDKAEDNASKTPEYAFRVLNEFPHDTASFTQGLEYRDGFLYESTGQPGTSWLRKIDLASGEVLQQHDLRDSLFGEGITIFGDKIYQLTWYGQVCFVYNRDTFDSVGVFRYTGQGWGLTHDDSNLIMSNGSSSLVFRDPETFEVVRQIEVRDHIGAVLGLNELEYIDGEIWANIYTWNFIARISPETGQVLGWIRLASLVPQGVEVGVLNGIALDHASGRILVTGKYWPKVFEIELLPLTQ